MMRLLVRSISIFFLSVSAWGETPPLTHIHISLGYHLDPCQAPVLYGIATGLFQQYGLHVTLMPASGGEESSRHVALKHAHIGITKSANHIVRKNKGMPLVQVGTLIAQPLEILMVRGEDQPHALPNLKGKRIGYSSSNPIFTQKVIDAYLKKAHLTRQDIQLIAFHKGMMQAFLNQTIDAMFTATAPYDTELATRFNVPFQTYTYDSFGVPSFAQFILFTHIDFKDHSFIKPFLKALHDAISRLKKEPDYGFKTVVSAYPSLNTPHFQKIWHKVVDHMVDDPSIIDDPQATELDSFLKIHMYPSSF